MKGAYCKVNGCTEHCIDRWSSSVCVMIGSGGVGLFTAINILGGIQSLIQKINHPDYIVLGISASAIILAIVISIFLSFFERFEHSLTALLFGASTPALLIGLCSISYPK